MYVTDLTQFVHVPKTGGNWVQQAFVSCGITLQLVGAAHGLPMLSQGPTKLTWCVVRHPASWLRSLWAYTILRRQRGEVVFIDGRWVPAFAYSAASGNALGTGLYLRMQEWLGNDIHGVPFPTFLAGYLADYPGEISRIFDWYASACHAVVRYDALATDAWKLLSLAGEPVDQRWFYTPPCNVTGAADTAPAHMLMKLAEVESEAIRRWKWLPVPSGFAQ